MSVYTPTLNGAPIFGWAVRMLHQQHPSAQQIVEFFGVDGTFALYGGSRGRVFAVRGFLVGQDLPTLNQAQSVFDTSVAGNIADGVGRTLFDTRGRTYLNVVYRGEFEEEEGGPRPGSWPTGSGYVLPYRLMLHGVT